MFVSTTSLYLKSGEIELISLLNKNLGLNKKSKFNKAFTQTLTLEEKILLKNSLTAL